MDIKHSSREIAIASVKGYIWFLSLNIIFAAWLIPRLFGRDGLSFQGSNYATALYAIFAFSLLNLFLTLRLGDRINEGAYQRCLPGIVLLFGVLWSIIFFNLLHDFYQPTIALVIMVMLLLPATITFYISWLLLALISLPIVLVMIYCVLSTTVHFNLVQGIGAVIILTVVLSARYILLESYQRTQRSEYEKNILIKKLVHLANYDTLTGLYNRHSLAEAFARNVRQVEQDNRSLYLIVMDIDFFKQYNDLYGHIEGDKCLIRVSRCIEQSLRKTSDAAFRFGGEEFVVLTLCDGMKNAVDIAKRIQHALAEARIPHKGSSVSHRVTLSLGIAQWKAEMPLETLIELADKQLYQAKHAGRNRICWDKKGR